MCMTLWEIVWGLSVSVCVCIYMCVCVRGPACRVTQQPRVLLSVGPEPLPVRGGPCCAAPAHYKACSAIISLFVVPPPLFHLSPPKIHVAWPRDRSWGRKQAASWTEDWKRISLMQLNDYTKSHAYRSKRPRPRWRPFPWACVEGNWSYKTCMEITSQS